MATVDMQLSEPSLDLTHPRFRIWRQRSTRISRTKRRVLIWDDNKPAAEALSISLTMDGFDTQFATHRTVVEKKLSAWHPHLVILKLSNFDGDGIHGVARIRQIAPDEHMAIVAFITKADDEVERPGAEAGIDAYCLEGSSYGDLIYIINHLST